MKEVAGGTRISVKDNGMGMPIEQSNNIFKPFYTTKQKGTGLGLVIVKKLLLNMNGDIEFESSERRGTTFNLFLPGGKNE